MPATITTWTPFADVGGLGVGSPRAANGHLIAIADDGAIVGVCSSDAFGPAPPRAYRTTDLWTTLTVTATFANETGAGAAFLSGLINGGGILFTGIWNVVATPDQAETHISTDDGLTWSVGEVMNSGANYFRPYCFIKMSNGAVFAGIGQAAPKWWVDAGGTGTGFVDQGNWAGEGADRMVMDAVEVGTTGVLVVATLTRVGSLGFKTLNVYTATAFGTGTLTVRLTDATLGGGTKVRLYSVPGGSTVLMTINRGTLGVDSIWRSADGGVTWSQRTGTSDAYGTFLLASNGEIACGSTLGGFYTSSDDGLTWTFISITGTPTAVQTFSFVEVGGRLFAAGTASVFGANSPYIFASNVLVVEVPLISQPMDCVVTPFCPEEEEP